MTPPKKPLATPGRFIGLIGSAGASNHSGPPWTTICSRSHTRTIKAHIEQPTTQQPFKQSDRRLFLKKWKNRSTRKNERGLRKLRSSIFLCFSIIFSLFLSLLLIIKYAKIPLTRQRSLAVAFVRYISNFTLNNNCNVKPGSIVNEKEFR